MCFWVGRPKVGTVDYAVSVLHWQKVILAKVWIKITVELMLQQMYFTMIHLEWSWQKCEQVTSIFQWSIWTGSNVGKSVNQVAILEEMSLKVHCAPLLLEPSMPSGCSMYFGKQRHFFWRICVCSPSSSSKCYRGTKPLWQDGSCWDLWTSTLCALQVIC